MIRLLAIFGAVGMAAFTAVSVAFAPEWASLTVVSLGSISISTFDLLFVLAFGLLFVDKAFGAHTETIALNRLVLALCWAYVGYQVFVVMPAAVLLHGLAPIDVFRILQVRLSLVLIPVTYHLILRHLRPSTLVAIVDVAAAALAIWVAYSYLAVGGYGYVESGVYRLRAAWTGAVLLFGWLFLTSMFFWKLGALRVALSLIALVGLGLANFRSGFVAFLAGFGVVLLTVRGISRRKLAAIAAVVALGLVLVVGESSVRTSVEYSLRTMFIASSDQTAQDRVERSLLGLEYFQEHPLGDFVWNRSYYLVDFGEADFVPHNFVVQMLVTQGAIASAIYFAIIGVTLLIGWRNREDLLSSVMFSYLVFYLVFCLFNPNIDMRENVSLFYIAVALTLHQNRERAKLGASAALVGHKASHIQT